MVRILSLVPREFEEVLYRKKHAFIFRGVVCMHIHIYAALYTYLNECNNDKTAQVHMYIAGFPCPPFSSAEQRQCVQDGTQRGTTFADGLSQACSVLTLGGRISPYTIHPISPQSPYICPGHLLTYPKSSTSFFSITLQLWGALQSPATEADDAAQRIWSSHHPITTFFAVQQLLPP